MKKLFIAVIAVMCCAAAAVLAASSEFGTVGDEGCAVPASAGIQQALAAGGGGPVSLVQVGSDDVIYSTLSGCYVGGRRNKIDITYPLYTGSGASIRFLGEENWLITPQADLYRTFEGLYISEGISYNADRTQADEGDFILVTLPNGLYMNAQQAVLEGPLGSKVIPANSIISLGEDALRWYRQKNGTLAYGSEEALFGASITIGSHRYGYADLLDALGLIRSAVDEEQEKEPDDEKLQEAEEILNKKKDNDRKNPGKDRDTADIPGGPEDDGNGGTQSAVQGGSPGAEGGEPGGPGAAEPEGTEGPGSARGVRDGGRRETETGRRQSGAETDGSGGADRQDESFGGVTGEDDTEDAYEGIEEGDEEDTGEEAGEEDGEDTGEEAGEEEDTGEGPGGEEITEESGAAGGSETAPSVTAAGPDAPSEGEPFSGHTLPSGSSGASEPASETAAAPTTEPVTEPSASSGSGTASEPASETAAAPTTEPVTEPSAPSGSGTATEPAAETTAAPTTEPVTEPSAPSGSGAASEPASETAAARPSEPVTGPAASSSAEPSSGSSVPATAPQTPASEPPAGGSGEGSQGGDSEGEPGAAGPGEGGDSAPVPYQTPAVFLSGLQTWSYAVGIDLSVDDPSGSIRRGISFAVYRSVSGSGEKGTDAEGHTIYPAGSYTGKSAVLRKTRNGSQSFAMSALKPGQTVYLQYSYRYDAEVKETVTDEVTGEEKTTERVVRKRRFSDLIELDIPDVDEGGVSPAGACWTAGFASHDHAVELRGLTLSNTSDYDPDAEYSFENFRLNTLPYVNRLELSLEPAGGTGAPAVVTVGSGTLLKARQPGGAVYISNSPRLRSNTAYRCTAAAKDRWNNSIPLISNGEEGYSCTVYTCKASPVAVITEKENVTDSLKLGIKISDPDRALAAGEPLWLSVRETSTGDAAALYGEWGGDISEGGERVYRLELKEPADGKEYSLDLQSLAFATLYDIEVRGCCAPQPDGGDLPGELAVRCGELFGTLTSYTASLSEGLVGFNTGVTDLMDTSATLSLTMNSDTTIRMLPMVDEFRVILRDGNGETVSASVLAQEALCRPGEHEYIAEDAALELEAGSDTEPRVVLYGRRDQIRGGNPWDSFCIAQLPPDPGPAGAPAEPGFTSPMELRVMMPPGSLTHFTDYSFFIQAVVKKSGREYFIPVSMTNTRFTTKKTLPQVRYDDLFLAADVAEFKSLKVYDPDGTVLNDGAVSVYLYYGGTLLKVKQITADRTGESRGEDLRFDGLIPGAGYTVKFVAAAYNDAEGYGSYRAGHVLASYNITGGSELTGKLTLNSLGRDSGGTGENLADPGKYRSGAWIYKGRFPYNNVKYISYYMPCEADTVYVITQPLGCRWITAGCCSVESLENLSGQTDISGQKEQKSHAPLIYRTSDDARFLVISLRSDQVSSTGRFEKEFTVRKYDPKTAENTFTGELSVRADDLKGYLGRGGNASVTLTLERSDSMEIPEYVPFAEPEALPLEEKEDGSLRLDTVKILKALEPDAGWRATLTAEYRGSEIRLDRITFRTDTDYVTVSSHREMIEAQLDDCRANILAVGDFVQDQDKYVKDFYGTIDFQGHIVTKGENITKGFLDVGTEGRVRNLVYEYPVKPYYINSSSVFSTIAGTVDNLIVRTSGQVEAASRNGNLIADHLTKDGILRNFIVRLGGDFSITYRYNSNVLCYSSWGLVENGYVYASGGSGMVFRNGDSTPAHGLIDPAAYCRHMYVVSDSWYQPKNNGALFGDNTRNETQDVYVVGDYYSVDPGAAKNWLLPLSKLRVIKRTGRNIWAVTSRTYSEDVNVRRSAVEKLYDADWQRSVLGEGFDTEGCVPMGFYPRLKLSPEMQKHQEYLPLPVSGQESTPKLVSDGWGEGEIYGRHGLDGGYIRLRFKNDNNYIIRSVTIDGLLTQLVHQEAAPGGLYDVILNVEVDPAAPRYTGEYAVSEVCYAAGSAVRSVRPGYRTSGIEFWKEIGSAQDWAAINDHMDWNYKLTADIDFGRSDLTYGQIVINGTQANFTAESWFTGKLDGQEHVLKNITLENITNPYVIGFARGAGISDLLVENLKITASKSARAGFTGFIGRAEFCILENVRTKNCVMGGGGCMGLLAGGLKNTYMGNCSAAESSIYDIDGGYPLIAGGLAGDCYGSYITSCYTRDVDIKVTDTMVSIAAGGLTGVDMITVAESCYAHGSITAAADYTGGIEGQTGSGAAFISRCWSYVDILQTAGSFTGGMSGRMTNAKAEWLTNSVALGDAEGPGTADRVVPGTTKFANAYAYEGQSVTGLGPGEKGNAGRLFTGAELARADTWQDIIQLGRAWDYAPVRGGFAPTLKDDCAREGWRQEKIYLPGQSGDPVLSATEASYSTDGARETYSLLVQLDHPGLKSSDIIGMYRDKTLEISMEGMDLSDAALSDESAEIELESSGGEGTRIRIITHRFDLALDSYALTVKYTEPSSGRERELTAMVKYLEESGSPHITYWKVPDLSRWNELMPDHGSTEENFLITGTVDFAGQRSEFVNLAFNRLDGKGDAAGFANLKHSGGLPGYPWIAKAVLSLRGLAFTNMEFDFSSATEKRVMTGAVTSLGGGEDLKLKNISMICNKYTCGYFAFISYLSGDLDGVEMEDITVKSVEKNAVGNYCGALTGSLRGGIYNVRAKNIEINCPGIASVGTVSGSIEEKNNGGICDISVENIEITGRHTVGGIIGGGSPVLRSRLSVTKGSVTAKQYSAGGIFGTCDSERAVNASDWLVKDVDVTAASGSAGGAIGHSYHNGSQRVTVENCRVTGGNYAGGYTGKVTGDLELRDFQLSGSQITSTGSENNKTGSVGAGGIFGAVASPVFKTFKLTGAAVRGSVISAKANAGGAAGHICRGELTGIFSRVYVAEDVKVFASERAAGGIAGSANWLELSDSACGADVASGNIEAGGIVGRAEEEAQSGKFCVRLSRVYYKGKVSAGWNFAGGLIGKLNSSVRKFTDREDSDTRATDLLVAADVHAAGEKISAWINSTAAAGDAGTGTIYICEDTLLNGQTIKAVKAAADAAGKTVYVIPKRMDDKKLMISAARFAQKDLYEQTLGYGGAWDLSRFGGEDNRFMPYTLNYGGTGILDAARLRKGEDGTDEEAGILLPGACPAGRETVVYASGAGTVNIEAEVPEGAESVTVTVNGKDYATDAAGVLTLKYDFRTPLKVGAVTREAEDLSRRVMTFGEHWYYIKDGKIHFGKAVGSEEDMREAGEVGGIEGAVHLWQGFAMDDAGDVYSLSGGQAVKDETSGVNAGNNLEKLGNARPFMSDGGVQVYYYFSLYNRVKIPYRVFLLDGAAYTVSPSQETVYDGVALSSRTSYGTSAKYFGLLGNDGVFTAHLSEMDLGLLTNRGILHSSSNMGYEGTVLLAYYGDGKIVGVDYATGSQVCSTLTAQQNMAAYASRSLAALFAAPSAGNRLQPEGSYLQGERLREGLAAAGTNAAPDDGANAESGNASQPGGASAPGEASAEGSSLGGGDAARQETGQGTSAAGNITRPVSDPGGQPDHEDGEAPPAVPPESAPSRADAEAGAETDIRTSGETGPAETDEGEENREDINIPAETENSETSRLTGGEGQEETDGKSGEDAAPAESVSVPAQGPDEGGDIREGAQAENESSVPAQSRSGERDAGVAGSRSGDGSARDGSGPAERSGSGAERADGIRGNDKDGEDAGENGGAEVGPEGSENGNGGAQSAAPRRETGAGGEPGETDGPAKDEGPAEDEGPADDVSGAGNKGAGKRNTAAEAKAMATLFGDHALVYSEVTGRYELFQTASVLSGTPVKVIRAAARRAENREDPGREGPEAGQQGGSFTAAPGSGRSIEEADRQGPALVALAAAAGVALLAVLYRKAVRRRKR